ncbi:MAG TPA: hypothetical protein VKZ60_17165 [Chloroflexota bacterium]|jgi:hypothetical protein|nr:hypothetical protein [Chloroflexota bacterium]
MVPCRGPAWRVGWGVMLLGATALMAPWVTRVARSGEVQPASVAPAQGQLCGTIPALLGTVGDGPGPWPEPWASLAPPGAAAWPVLMPVPYPWYPAPLRVYTDSTVCIWQGR